MDLLPHTVAVIATPGPDRLLRRCTTALEETPGLRTHVLTADSPRTAAAAVPDDAGALVLPHANRDFAAEVQALTGRTAVTTEDTTSIALAAALSTTLARAGRRPRSGHVVIAGAGTLPLLFPLVMLAGVGQVTKWEVTDASAFPLHRVTADADVVIDLVAATDGTGDVITPDPERDPVLALPGLVSAIAQAPHATLDIEVHRACALALVMATAPTRTRPDGPNPELTDAVAAAVLRTFGRLPEPRWSGTEADQGGS